MGLLQNGFRDRLGVYKLYGATLSNGASPYISPDNTTQVSSKRNLTAGEGISSELVSIPSGARHPVAWMMPQKPGAVSSRNRIEASGSLVGSGAMGVNGSASLSATSDLTATGQLVVSGSATLTATGSLEGNIVAALAASAALSASGSLTGTAVAKGFMSATLSASASVTLTSYAVGYMSASIQPPTQLEAAEFSSYVLDSENVETGLTVRNALRLIAAATAGELSGASSTTITIRNAVADDKDRIVATVTSEGNRTAITYDLTDS